VIYPTHKHRTELTGLKHSAAKPNKRDRCSQSSLGLEAIPENHILQVRPSPSELDVVPFLPN